MVDTSTEPKQANELWRRLTATSWIRELYRDGNPAHGLNATVLRALFTYLDDNESVGTTLGICVQSTTALPLLAAARRDESALDPLSVIADAVLAGKQMVGLAATDDTPGSNLTTLATTVTIDDERVILSGRKKWIANAVFASHLLVLARQRAGSAFTNFTWVVVPTDAPGVTVEAVPAPLFAGSGTGHATFRDVTLPLAYLGGPVGRGLIDFASHICVERLASAMWGHAMCARVLRETVDYLRQRGQGPANLWGKEEIRRRIAKCLISTTLLDILLDRCQHDILDRHDSLSASLVKATAADTVEEVLSVTSHLQGARAFIDGGLQTLRAQAGLWSIGGGTYEVMLSTIAAHADHLLGEAS